MSRPLVLGLFAGALALGAGMAGWLLSGDAACTRGPAVLESEGLLEAQGGPRVLFTLYRPAGDGERARSLVIFAADARAEHPRPLREWARAAAASGVVAAYLEPSDAPEEAAGRLRTALGRHAEALGIDAEALWTWAEGGRLQGPPPAPAPCGWRSGLAAAVARAERKLTLAGSALQHTLEARAGCPLAGLP
ncbi:MAG TPA: hypothetical protein VEJ89_10570 [Myxococcaceae bacterium]|nr:hypothetical protein [Myxococcaceae bacterium]